jgi:hypothetical protein
MRADDWIYRLYLEEYIFKQKIKIKNEKLTVIRRILK